MDDIQTLIWKNIEIGSITNIRMDMWYIEGVYIPNHTVSSANFIKLVSKFNGEKIIKDPSKGTIVVMKDLESQTNCLVLGLSGIELFLRIASDDIAEWIIKAGK